MIMKLSFVIPAYNEEQYIGKCLSSIFRELKGRSYDTEVIVVNNASTDNTRQAALAFPGVTVVDEMTKGIVHARHAGFSASSGELVANIDADTILTPGWLDTVMSEFSKNEKLVGLSGPFVYYDVSKSLQHFTAFFYRLGYVSYFMNKFVWRVGSMLQGGNFVVRRSALEQAGGFDRNITFYGEDADIARRLHKVGDVKFTFALPMYASGRRIVKEGAFTMGFRYGTNYLWTTFFKKPFSKNYSDIRLADNGDAPLKYDPQNRRHELRIAVSIILILLGTFGMLGFVIADQVSAKETPRAFVLRMYHKFSDNDGDLQALRLKWESIRQNITSRQGNN